VLLDVSDLCVNYGRVEALRDVSFSVAAGEILVMIGPNGAGKSTALKAVSGVLDFYRGRVNSGNITLNGRNITAVAAHELTMLGMGVVPDGRRVFASMTVQENLEMGSYTRTDVAGIKSDLDRVVCLFPVLKERFKQSAGTLSGGEQQMLVLGRALMLRPTLLLVDEPSLGLSPNYVELIFEKFIEINCQGVTIVLAEQNARMALEIAHRGIVFDIGCIALQDTSDVLRARPEVQHVYLGG
jgi:branched-chain amino acid transport system ATP-binding protein